MHRGARTKSTKTSERALKQVKSQRAHTKNAESQRAYTKNPRSRGGSLFREKHPSKLQTEKSKTYGGARSFARPFKVQAESSETPGRKLSIL